MTKPHLPDVTLVMIDATCPELARLAVADSLDQCSFGDTLVCSPVDIGADVKRWIKTAEWPDRFEMSNFFLYELPYLITTKFFLVIDYDGWVIDGSQWTDEFLQYDYGGMAWWYKDGMNVGHGRFYSLKFALFIAEHRERFPNKFPWDHVVSREYRRDLEAEGFRWMPEHLAVRFGFECTRPSFESKHFMFHDVFNFPFVLPQDRLDERMRLLRANDYVVNRTPKLQELAECRCALLMPELGQVA